METKKLLGFSMTVLGLGGCLLSLVLDIGTIAIVLSNHAVTTLSLLIVIFLTICSVTTFGVGLLVFRFGEFP